MTRLLRRRFNDDFYAVPVSEWEQDQVRTNFWFSILQWGVFLLAPAVFGIGSLLQVNGRGWLALSLAASVVLMLFVHLHEINENVRYVRHQLRVQREAYEAAAKQFRAYKTPEESVTPFEVIETFDREWGP